jgi:hypothetical protein
MFVTLIAFAIIYKAIIQFFGSVWIGFATFFKAYQIVLNITVYSTNGFYLFI